MSHIPCWPGRVSANRLGDHFKRGHTAKQPGEPTNPLVDLIQKGHKKSTRPMGPFEEGTKLSKQEEINGWGRTIGSIFWLEVQLFARILFLLRLECFLK